MSDPAAVRPTLGPATPLNVEVDLFGRLFTLKTVTRSVQRSMDEMLERLNAAGEADDVVNAVGDLFDLLLAPTNGQRTTPKKIVADKWQGDELTLASLLAFLGDLQVAVESPPT